VRPAPAEIPQGRKTARVGGCSGATQVAYPLFLKFCEEKVVKKVLHIKKLLLFFAALKSETAHVLLKKLKYK